MVIDTLANSHRYENLHPRFKAAFAFLRRPDLATLATGRTAIDGDALFALVQEYETKPVSDGRLEAHKKYIDLQFVVAGEEHMGYLPLTATRNATPFDVENDYTLCDGDASLVRVSQGMFAIFYPEDAHLPCRHIGQPRPVKKIVLKIEISA